MKQIRTAVAILAVMTFAGANAATLRVNNVASAGAQFTSVNDALEAASEGDVIILEPSVTSYGDFEVLKKVTIKGSGYLMSVNHPSATGAADSKTGIIKVRVPGVVLTGLDAGYIEIYASQTVVTRCDVEFMIEIGSLYTDRGEISDCIIHQNFLHQGVTGSQMGTPAKNIQITNNIFCYFSGGINSVTNSVIKYNTFNWNDTYSSAFGGVKNSVIEHNIGGNQAKGDASNSFADNVEHTKEHPYGTSYYDLNDAFVKEVDATLSTEHGAFAGETPYVLSGVPTGPVILDVELPNAVVKGEDLNVTVTIGTQK